MQVNHCGRARVIGLRSATRSTCSHHTVVTVQAVACGYVSVVWMHACVRGSWG